MNTRKRSRRKLCEVSAYYQEKLRMMRPPEMPAAPGQQLEMVLAPAKAQQGQGRQP